MANLRTLWTGPCGVDPRSLVIRAAVRERSAVWLVTSPLARDQIRRSLAIAAAGTVVGHRVWTWSDAWQAVAAANPDPPARLSPAGRRAVLDEAVRRARPDADLGPLGSSLRFAGYRRQLLDRFSAWTRSELDPGRTAPHDTPAGRAEWALFGHYRAALAELRAVDPAGWATWASREIARNAPPGLRKPGMVIAVEPVAPGRAGWRLLHHCQKVAKGMFVLLPWTDEPSLAEAYAAPGRARKRFLAWGFREEVSHPDLFRPPGLRAVAQEVFRDDSHARPSVQVRPGGGLAVVGGPEGDGVALLVAREVRRAVEGPDPVDPDDVLILLPRLDASAEPIRATLRAWGLPVAEPAARPLRSIPTLTALRRAMRLAAEGWEAAPLVRLLRNGLIDWDRVAPGGSALRFEAASAVRATRVFRDRTTLRRSLERPDPDKPDRPGGREARILVDGLAALLDPLARPGTWAVQSGRARKLARGLGLDGPDLEPFWDLLDEVRSLRAGLGPAVADSVGSWRDFADEVDALVDDAEVELDPPVPGRVRIEAVDAVEGARARVVILANLAERTFPAPRAIDLGVADASVDADPDAGADLFEIDPETGEEVEPGPEPEAAATAYGREMFRFLRVAGMAEDALVLAYPTTNLSGEDLLPAGFLDDVVRRLDGGYDAPVVERHPRFDPVLIGHEDLAVAPPDRRVLAVAQACRDFGAAGDLRRLGRDPGQRVAWEGTAWALEMADARLRDRRFGSFDGLLRDPGVIAEVAAKFGPDHSFSASQLESFALCPFQFFLRYALGLKPVDERRELDEDYAGRGSDIHRILETVHAAMATEPAAEVHERLGELIRAAVRRELEPFHDGPGDVAQVLREIGARRTEKILGRYQAQFRTYVGQGGGTPTPHRFEVLFGQPDKDGSLPHLALGSGASAAQFQGVIDRIDLIERDGSTSFRVIDYKTGSNPSPGDVLNGRASQLPLYALAVEQLVLPDAAGAAPDVGYWSLPKQGFKRIKLDDWEGYRADLIEFVLGIVARLRGGAFPVESRKKECVDFCDFRAMCRVHQARRAGKVWNDAPLLGGRAG